MSNKFKNPELNDFFKEEENETPVVEATKPKSKTKVKVKIQPNAANL